MHVFSLFSILYFVLEIHITRLWREYLTLLCFVLILLSGWYFFYNAPGDFPNANTEVTIVSGNTLQEVAASLVSQHVIRSAEVFVVVTRLFSDEHGIQAGTYLFSKPYDVAAVVYKVTHGISDRLLTQVTFKEGITVREMAEILKEKFPTIDSQRFTNEALPHEGYLFPDTYRFVPTVTSEEVVETLQTTFTQKTDAIQNTTQSSTHTFTDIIIMASILEREARSSEEKRMVADILWRRLAEGMPLQVDAVFGYIKNTDTYRPSFADLQIQSPYNTYRNKGLPPTPISNPGLESIVAAATPLPSTYVYYLTGKDGMMHYAKTFEEHKANRAKYLD